MYVLVRGERWGVVPVAIMGPACGLVAPPIRPPFGHQKRMGTAQSAFHSLTCAMTLRNGKMQKYIVCIL